MRGNFHKAEEQELEGQELKQQQIPRLSETKTREVKTKEVKIKEAPRTGEVTLPSIHVFLKELYNCSPLYYTDIEPEDQKSEKLLSKQCVELIRQITLNTTK